MSGKLKAIGQAILLAAFVGQWWFLESAKDDDNNYQMGSTSYAVTRVASLQYVGLYFQTNDVSHLRRSAHEEINALFMIQLPVFEDSQKAIESRNRLQKHADAIKDLPSYNAFIATATAENATLDTFSDRRLEQIRMKKKVSWWIVAVLSLVGMTFIAMGEWRSDTPHIEKRKQVA